MARITVEDCLDHQGNRFSLVRLAARRAKQILAGSTPVTDTKGNRAIVSALREIAAGKVTFRNEESSPAKEFSDPLLEELDLATLTSPSARPATTTPATTETAAAAPPAAAAEAAPAEEASEEPKAEEPTEAPAEEAPVAPAAALETPASEAKTG